MNSETKRRRQRGKAKDLFERLMKKEYKKGWFMRYMKTPFNKLPQDER